MKRQWKVYIFRPGLCACYLSQHPAAPEEEEQQQQEEEEQEQEQEEEEQAEQEEQEEEQEEGAGGAGGAGRAGGAGAGAGGAGGARGGARGAGGAGRGRGGAGGGLCARYLSQHPLHRGNPARPGQMSALVICCAPLSPWAGVSTGMKRGSQRINSFENRGPDRPVEQIGPALGHRVHLGLMTRTTFD